jgi:exonuclease SbcC
VVQRACKRLDLAGAAERERASRFANAESLVLHAQQLGHEAAALDQRLAAIEREAGQASMRADELRRRFGLTAQVPCAGMDLQRRCQLLGDTREAQALIPSADRTIAQLADERLTTLAALDHCRVEQSKLTGAAERLSRARRLLAVARTRASRLAEVAARKDHIDLAQTTLRAAEHELAALPQDAGQPDDERREHEAIDAALTAIARERATAESSRSAAAQRIDEALDALPAPFDEARLKEAESAVAAAQARAALEDQAHFAAIRDAHALESLTEQARELGARQAASSTRERRIVDELGHWNLLARCLSNDGVIALAIDDAGPALAGFANDLLLACYGPRFTVSIRTLVETAKGEPREGFDIVVHDAESGDSKSVGLMSGGERVWINECLTRAIALYLAQNAARRYAVLFSDEADGALDPERKRMFMAMKREVLRLGGYEQEFFVSQSPELAALADAVIDLDEIAARPCARQ